MGLANYLKLSVFYIRLWRCSDKTRRLVWAPITNVGNLELKDLRRGSHYPSHLEIQPDISQVSGNTHSTQINYGRGQFGTSQQVENSKRLF